LESNKDLWIFCIKESHAYRVNRRKELVETWNVDGATIVGVPFCGLKGIKKKTTDI